MIKEIQVEKIDPSVLDAIQAAHSALVASSDATKELHLNIISAGGEKEVSVQAAQILHSDSSVIPVTNASGAMDVAATILVAAGFEGRRTADPKSSFVINDGETYGKDSKPEDLDSLDYFVYDALAKMTGRKYTILKKMLEGGSFSPVVAKKCGIIDEVSGFKSAFRPQKVSKGRGRKKAGNTSTATAPVVSPDGSIASVSPKPSPRPRAATVKTAASGNVQRGRIG